MRAYGPVEYYFNTYNLKEIHAIGSEKIDATDGQTDDGWMDDRQQTNFDFMSLTVDTVKQS